MREGWVVALILVACIPYIRGLTGAFVWDDRTYFLDNDVLPRLKPWDISSILLRPSNAWGEHLPLRDFLFVLQYNLFGQNPLGYHIVSLCLYFAVGLILYRFTGLLYRQFREGTGRALSGFAGATLPALFVSVFFLLHPVHVEAVSYISGQKDLLFSFFTFSALFMFLKYVAVQELHRGKCMFFFIAFYYLAFLSKAAAVATALFIPVFWLLFLKKEHDSTVRASLFWIAINIPAFLWMLYTINLAHVYQGSVQELVQIPFMENLFRALKVVGAHVLLVLKPFPLNFGYPFDGSFRLDAHFFVGLSFLVLFVFFMLKKRKALIFLGLLIFFLYLFPSLQLFVPVGNAVIYDRYLFIPVLGVGIVIESTISAIVAKWQSMRNIAISILICIVMSLGLLTYRYIPAFQSDVASTRHAYETFPDWPTTSFNYVYALIEAGKFAEAMDITLEEKTFDKPQWVRDYFLGWIYLEKGDRKEALKLLERSSYLCLLGGYFPFPNVPLGKALIEEGQNVKAQNVLNLVLISKILQPVEQFKAKKLIARVNDPRRT